jgi:predicted ABC-type ATPase
MEGGKSTIRNLIVDRLGISVNIDPDALARGIDSVHPESRKVSAGKEPSNWSGTVSVTGVIFQLRQHWLEAMPFVSCAKLRRTDSKLQCSMSD